MKSLAYWIAAAASAVVFAALGCSGRSSNTVVRSKPPARAAPGLLNVEFQASDMTRPGIFRLQFDKSGNPIFEDPKETTLIAGTVQVGGKTFTLYMPGKGPYPVANSGEDNHLSNTSTVVTVDSNDDGELEESENWFANLPIRLGDEMFEIKKIADDGGWLQLAASKAPLAGAVVGWKCPDFSYTDMDGKAVSLADYKGKALLLDVWSMT